MIYSASLSDPVVMTESLSVAVQIAVSDVSDSVAMTESLSGETIRFSPHPPKYRPVGFVGEQGEVFSGFVGRGTGYQIGGAVGSG